MSPDAMAVQVAANPAQHETFRQRPDDGGRALEEIPGAAREIGLREPAPVDQDPVEMILEHLLGRPAHAAPTRVASAIDVDAVLLLEIQADQRRILDLR